MAGTAAGPGLWPLARSIGWCLATGSWPRSCIFRHGTTNDVLACWFGVGRSTNTRAMSEPRPLLAEWGRTVSPGVRLRTLGEAVDHFGSSQRTGIQSDGATGFWHQELRDA